MIDYEKLYIHINHLQDQFTNYLAMDTRTNLSDLDRDAIRESVIQRFETCYDTLWKHLKKYLEQELGLPDIPNSPKPVLRIAFENGIIDNIEIWFAYARARIDTAHDYSIRKVNDALDKIEGFLTDANRLYRRISNNETEHKEVNE